MSADLADVVELRGLEDRRGQLTDAHRAERAVVGALLGGWADVDDLGLAEPDFADPRLGTIFEAIAGRLAQGQPADPVAMLPALTARGRLVDGDLGVYLIELMESCPLTLRAPFYAQQVAEAATRRRIIAAAQATIQAALQDDRPAAELAEDARARFDQVPQRAEGAGQLLGDVLPRVIDQIERGVQKGLSTPWPDLDRLINGLHPGKVLVLGARPGVGKSLFGQGIARHMAERHNAPVFYASLEMPADELAQRFLADKAGVNLRHLQNGELTETQWERIAEAASALRESGVILDDTATQTLASIRRGARDTLRRFGQLGAVVVDYLQLVTARDGRIPREQQVAEMSRGFKLLARELGVPVIVLAQLNRDAADRRPRLNDLRESGAVEQDADIVVLLSEDGDLPGEVLADVAKQRNGPLGELTLAKQGHYARLASLAG